MADRWILQFCHSHYGPFLDVARQYSSLFNGRTYKVLTVYLTGDASLAVREGSASDEVIFLDYKSRDVRGLKLGAIQTLRKIIESRDIALVIAHRFKPIYIACLATKLPVIGVHHAFGDYDRPHRCWFATIFRKRLALLAVSNAVRDDIRKRLPKWPINRIETLHNRLDVDKAISEIVPRGQARDVLGLPRDAIVVGNVGRLHSDKDQMTLLAGFASALPELPAGALLVIAGSGPLETSLKSRAQTLGIGKSVRFLGQVPNVRRLFSVFDVFVLSSDHEPFGMVLLEAMAAGVPVMATNCGGAPEVVGRNDLLFDQGNSAQLATLLKNFFATSDGSHGKEIINYGQSRLRSTFSDDIARTHFFSLAMVQAVLGNHGTT